MTTGAGIAASALIGKGPSLAAQDDDLRSIGRTPHTRFAVNIEMWWRGLPFLERIEKAAELGFPAVEFWPWQGKDIPAVAAKAKALGVAVAQFTAWGFSPGLNDPKNHRVDHRGHCLYGSEPALRICDAVASPSLKINWDLYHMQITEGDLSRRLREGFRHVGYLQLADNPGRNEPGTGEVHYNRVLKEAHDLGYRGFVGLECSPKQDEITAARRVAAADVW
jgi:hydroxypyruvate isomerase